MLQWKSNVYYIFWACVCSLSYLAVESPADYLALPYFSTSCINPFVTSGTCMSHLQIALSSLLGYQYPTSSPCYHLPWTISTSWNQSECIFPWNSRLQMLLCVMLRGWLSVVTYFSQFWVYFSEISVIGAFIFSALLFTMHLYMSCLFYSGIERDMIKNVYLSSCKVPLILFRF